MGKSAGVDNVPAELVQAGGGAMIDILTSICNKIWKTGFPMTRFMTSAKTVKCNSQKYLDYQPSGHFKISVNLWTIFILHYSL